MTSDPAMHRRVSRLENDTESIYELIGDFRAEFTEFTTETRAEFENVRTELTGFRSELTGFRTELTGFRTELTGFRTELTGFAGELTGFAGELTGFRSEFNEFKTETRGQFERITETLTEVVRRLPEPS
jgi:chromosome segregation ATPase